MSFARAKLKRFNEIPKPTPSPAEYNVDLKDKPKLAFIPQCERFTEPRSPTSILSECGSTQSTPCFRTPTIIKKKKLQNSASKLKLHALQLSDKELLHEKIVECENKDSVIKELSEHLEDLKSKIYTLNSDIENLNQCKQKFENEIDELNKKHIEVIERLSVENDQKLSELNCTMRNTEKEIQNLNDIKQTLLNEINDLKKEHEEENELLYKKVEEKLDLIKSLEEKLKQAEEQGILLVKEHENTVKKLSDKHKDELQNIEYEMLKCIHDAQKSLDEEKRRNKNKLKELQKHFETEIDNMKHSFNLEKEKINKDNTDRIKQLEENMAEMKLLSEIQNKEKCTELENYWKCRLKNQEQEAAEILKECQAISEYNIIQSEIEKNECKLKVKTEKRKYVDLEKKYDSIYFNYKQLQSSYSNVQNKLYRLIKELREKDGIKLELKKLIEAKQTYETTILRSQQTIDILKRRLTDSDQDVEQLKNEISENEIKLLDYENKFNIMSTELQDVKSFNEELEMNNESTIKITQEEISKIKIDLLEKVENLKLEAVKKQLIYQEELKQKEKEKEKLLKMMQDQNNLNAEAEKLLAQANVEIERLTTENTDLLCQIEMLNQKNTTLQTKIDELTDEKKNSIIDKKELNLKIDIFRNEINELRKCEQNFTESIEKINELERNCKSLEEENSRKDLKIAELEDEIGVVKKNKDNLETINHRYKKKIEEQKALIAPFKDQLEAYELEMNNLQNAKNIMENEAKDIGIKYAQILGHQNHKQKIKYMVNLKMKNEDLVKTNLDLEAKLRLQEKKIEKLKKENADLKRPSRNKISILEDKENMASPNRSFKCESPGPLRELN